MTKVCLETPLESLYAAFLIRRKGQYLVSRDTSTVRRVLPGLGYYYTALATAFLFFGLKIVGTLSWANPERLERCILLAIQP